MLMLDLEQNNILLLIQMFLHQHSDNVVYLDDYHLEYQMFD